jgi:hypothetical protein
MQIIVSRTRELMMSVSRRNVVNTGVKDAADAASDSRRPLAMIAPSPSGCGTDA